MKIFTGVPSSWNEEGLSYAVAVGVFDGVHRGHRAVFRELHRVADGRPTAVLTFGNHPDAVVSGMPSPPALTSMDKRIELIAEEGFDAAALIDFDERVRMLSPEEFTQEYLVDALRAGIVVVGTDFRFGYEAAGTVNTLRILGGRMGFEVVETPIVDLYGTEVRSSAIRAAIASGGVELASRLLGRPFCIEGTVVPGDARGRSIGFATANITVPDDLVRPAGGVYAVVCTVDGTPYPGVCNVGTRPTFGGEFETIEVHLLDEDVDLYGKQVRVEFIDRLRNEQRFASVDALVAQIEDDIDHARAVLAEVDRTS